MNIHQILKAFKGDLLVYAGFGDPAEYHVVGIEVSGNSIHLVVFARGIRYYNVSWKINKPSIGICSHLVGEVVIHLERGEEFRSLFKVTIFPYFIELVNDLVIIAFNGSDHCSHVEILNFIKVVHCSKETLIGIDHDLLDGSV